MLNTRNSILDTVCGENSSQLEKLTLTFKSNPSQPKSTQFLQIVRGLDAIGKTEFLRALRIPEKFAPASLRRIALGNQASKNAKVKKFVKKY